MKRYKAGSVRVKAEKLDTVQIRKIVRLKVENYSSELIQHVYLCVDDNIQ